MPEAANASTSPSPLVTPGADNTSEIPATSGSPPIDLNTSVKTLPYSSHAPAIESSKEVSVFNATSLAARVHELINRVRQENGRSVLGMDAALASLARAHSKDMAAHMFFGHVNLDERDATARGAAAGYLCHKAADPYYTYAIAENIFATYRHSSILLVNGRVVKSEGKSEEEIARETVDAWMNSSDHRENILNPCVGREGIGIAIAKDDLVFVTEYFC